eukprot:TRINITY_DN27684_c0_g1_i1.p1 TRINITY_DN27684_c0_g1~~TRINITY_DN27684_c0_g1_i1.p1  ORF type:complete len:993 (+),score=132.77 TRINITY_DN27684_c0_g1_i1:248-2980(+)
MANVEYIKVLGEVLQIQLSYPLLRDTAYVVHLSPWSVRAVHPRPQERYHARWSGLDGPLLEFTTGKPQAQAEISFAVACAGGYSCAKTEQALHLLPHTLAEDIACFLAWYRCIRDPWSTKVCRQNAEIAWCNIYAASWKVARQSAPSFEAVQREFVSTGKVPSAEYISMVGQPIKLRHALHSVTAGPEWIWGCSLAAMLISALAVFRSVQWFVDVYRDSREFDPFVVQTTATLPYYSCLVVVILSVMVCLSGAVSGPSFYHFASHLHGAKLKDMLEDATDSEKAERWMFQVSWAAAVSLAASASVNAMLAFGLIARFKHALFELGQQAALLAIGLSWTALIGGACNWSASVGPLISEERVDRELHFEAAILAICGCGLVSLLFSLVMMPILLGGIFWLTRGGGSILAHCVSYSWMQLWYWKDAKGPIGEWDQWILHVRDIQILYGFALQNKKPEEGFISLKFYTTDEPHHIHTTRTLPAHYLTTNNNVFDGETVHIKIGSISSVVVIDVVHQQHHGGLPERVASAMWDPWNQEVLSTCFPNWQICNPNNNRNMWDFHDLIDVTGIPKPKTCFEFRLDLTPAPGLISFQAAHLGPARSFEERKEPFDIAMKESFLGDTFMPNPSDPSKFARRHPEELLGIFNLADKDSDGGIGRSSRTSVVKSISGTVDTSIVGVELKLSNGGVAQYGHAGIGERFGPHALEPSEFIFAVQQHIQDPKTDVLGCSLNFFTSHGYVGGISSGSGRDFLDRSKRFGVTCGQQIRGLDFKGQVMEGLLEAPVDDQGIVSEVKAAKTDATISKVEFIRRDGGTPIVYPVGAPDGGATQSLKKLDPGEFLIAVSQELSSEAKGLGVALVFFTSKGNVFRIQTPKATKDVAFAAKSGTQISGLKLQPGKFDGIETAPAPSWSTPCPE